jgi:hypothetical protein
MAITGAAAEASSQSRRRTLDTIPGRVGAGVSFDSTIGKDGAAEIGLGGWIGMVGWLRIMAFSRTGNGWQFKSLQVREWAGRTLQTALGTSDRGPRLQPADQASITQTG